MRQLGYSARPVDAGSGLQFDQDYLETSTIPEAASRLEPGPRRTGPSLLTYWHRESPDYLVATEIKSNLLTPGIVTLEDPAPILSGMAEVSLDPQGRLVHFTAVPPQKDSAPTSAAALRLEPSVRRWLGWTWRNSIDYAGLELAGRC